MIGLQTVLYAKSPQVTKRCHQAGSKAIQREDQCIMVRHLVAERFLKSYSGVPRTGDPVNIEFEGGRNHE